MSTRGFIGFVIDGEVKATYNHSDSYPSWLGVRVLFFTRGIQGRLALTAEQAAKLKLVEDDRDPIPNPLGYHLGELVDASVGGQNLQLPDHPSFQEWTGSPSWYQILRKAQGDLLTYLELGYMEDGGADFAKDSLFAEWGYLVNLDEQVLEVYKGFQTQPHESGRFADVDAKPADWAPEYKGQSFYHPVAEVARFDFRHLPSDEAFVALLEPRDDDANPDQG